MPGGRQCFRPLTRIGESEATGDALLRAMTTIGSASLKTVPVWLFALAAKAPPSAVVP